MRLLKILLKKKKKDVQSDDSEVESDDGKSCERAKLQTKEKDLKKFKEQGEG